MFSQVRARDVGGSFILIFVGQIFRFCGSFLSSYSNKYTVKESIFISIAWIPKSTVPATLAGVIYNEALSLGDTYKDYQHFGLQIQTTCILSIFVCVLIGTFSIDHFAPKLLTIDKGDSAVDKSNDLEKKVQELRVAVDKSEKEVSGEISIDEGQIPPIPGEIP